MRALERHDPRTIGRYRVLARISAGGLAIVYFGRSSTGRAVALKAVHTEFAADPAYRDRFRREVAAARAVGGRYSPGIVDADPDAAVPWLAMEFLPSVTLRDAAPLPSPAVWTVAAGLVEALASVHRAGVAHLDLKPANVLLTGDGPRLADFGIAATLRDGQAHLGGVPVGSPGYLAAEQAAGGWVSAASDVFSLGATLSFALTGNPRDADVGDERLRALIEPCLRVDPAQRPRLADLAPALAEFAGAPLPAAVTTEIATRAGEARNPPLDPLGGQAPRRLGRRAVLLGAGALVAGGGVAAALIAAIPEDETAKSGTTTRATPTSDAPAQVTTSVAPEPRMLEIYAFGDARLKALTVTINGDRLTLRNVKLPYRKLVEIPEWPQRTTYRIVYHHGEGQFTYKVIADGQEYASGGSSSTGGDVKPDPVEGTI
ncbi:MAG: serine/threonine-protein kinase [Actinophytocola sp.]|uniref:serine/threonine-protein kinase n=1 Tax=Actinophytocola sp. TaxID=1872138 RepID=UPI003D6A7489